VLGGRYQAEELLGSGGMAAVWRGRDLRLDRPVAIKVLAGAGLTEPMALERFDREARAAARLAPNVVGVYDFGAATTFLPGDGAGGGPRRLGGGRRRSCRSQAWQSPAGLTDYRRTRRVITGTSSRAT
jgi:hypothetical protein